jgi:hypothetical protein
MEAFLAKEKLTTNVDGELLERLKNAAYWLRLPLAGLVENAVTSELAKLERKHNGGKPFQKRSGELIRGARSK